MLNDRGSKKWTSIMLPEHVKGLKQLFKEETYKKMPILDEQQKIQNGLLLQAALKDDLVIKIIYFKDCDFRVMTGHILYFDTLNGVLRMEDSNIKLKEIIEVDLT